MRHRAARSPRRFLKPSMDGAIYHSRWLLYPVCLGLIGIAVVCLLRFLWQSLLVVRHAPAYIVSLDDNALVLIGVNSLEALSIVALLIQSIMGTHQIYIRRFKKDRNGPQWLEHIDTVTLKMKLGLAFASVSCALLLKDLLISGAVTHEEWLRHIITHCVFLATTVTAAVVWRLMNPQTRREAQ